MKFDQKVIKQIFKEQATRFALDVPPIPFEIPGNTEADDDADDKFYARTFTLKLNPPVRSALTLLKNMGVCSMMERHGNGVSFAPIWTTWNMRFHWKRTNKNTKQSIHSYWANVEHSFVLVSILASKRSTLMHTRQMRSNK